MEMNWSTYITKESKETKWMKLETKIGTVGAIWMTSVVQKTKSMNRLCCRIDRH